MSDHGTTNRYTNGRCRCDLCRAAQRAYMMRYRRARGVQPKQPRTHGKHYTYKHGCRCDPCREAAMEYQRVYRSRTKAAR